MKKTDEQLAILERNLTVVKGTCPTNTTTAQCQNPAGGGHVYGSSMTLGQRMAGHKAIALSFDRVTDTYTCHPAL